MSINRLTHIFIVFIFWFPLAILGQEKQDSLPKKHLKIIFAGDLMSHGPQIKAAYNDSLKKYDYYENFAYLNNIFASSDYVIANLETTLGVKPFSGYPQFSAPLALVRDAHIAGITSFVTANNHSCDKKKKGIISTLDVLDSLYIQHSGTYRNQAERDSLTPLIIEKDSIKIALLNYTYGTNGLAVPFPTKVNLIDTLQIKKDLIKTKLSNPDEIIVFLHWGIQYQNKASKRQKKLAKFLHKNGVNLVIGSHPHVIQPVEVKKDSLKRIHSLTVYSLGNFLSNQRTFPRDGSMLVAIDLTKEKNNKTYISDLKIIPIWVYKYFENKKRHYEILPVKDFILQPDFFKTNKDYQKMMKYYKHFLGFQFEKL